LTLQHFTRELATVASTGYPELARERLPQQTKTKPMSILRKGIFTAAVATVTAISSNAAVVVTTDFQTNGTSSLPHTYVPSTTDLINGLAPTSATGKL
jgi:hypothetical protein